MRSNAKRESAPQKLTLLAQQSIGNQARKRFSPPGPSHRKEAG
jgi:hypothetical protein